MCPTLPLQGFWRVRASLVQNVRLNTWTLEPKIVSTGPTPEWDESFVWSFESPPKGQKLHISCKNKSKMGKKSFGKVTIQIDRVVMMGAVAGEYALLPQSKSGAQRNLEIEIIWSNALSSSST